MHPTAGLRIDYAWEYRSGKTHIAPDAPHVFRGIEGTTFHVAFDDRVIDAGVVIYGLMDMPWNGEGIVPKPAPERLIHHGRDIIAEVNEYWVR
jgi:hypothetical protein